MAATAAARELLASNLKPEEIWLNPGNQRILTEGNTFDALKETEQAAIRGLLRNFCEKAGNLKQLMQGQEENKALAEFLARADIYPYTRPALLGPVPEGETDHPHQAFIFFLIQAGNQVNLDAVLTDTLDRLPVTHKALMATAIVSKLYTIPASKLQNKTLLRVSTFAAYNPLKTSRARIQNKLKLIANTIVAIFTLTLRTPPYRVVSGKLHQDILRAIERREQEKKLMSAIPPSQAPVTVTTPEQPPTPPNTSTPPKNPPVDLSELEDLLEELEKKNTQTPPTSSLTSENLDALGEMPADERLKELLLDETGKVLTPIRMPTTANNQHDSQQQPPLTVLDLSTSDAFNFPNGGAASDFEDEKLGASDFSNGEAASDFEDEKLGASDFSNGEAASDFKDEKLGASDFSNGEAASDFKDEKLGAPDFPNGGAASDFKDEKLGAPDFPNGETASDFQDSRYSSSSPRIFITSQSKPPNEPPNPRTTVDHKLHSSC